MITKENKGPIFFVKIQAIVFINVTILNKGFVFI